MAKSCSSSNGDCVGCAPSIQLVGVGYSSYIGDFGTLCEGKKYAISTSTTQASYFLHLWYESTYNGSYSSNYTSELKYGIDEYGNFYALTVTNGSISYSMTFTSAGEGGYTLNYEGLSNTEQTFTKTVCGPNVTDNSSCSTKSDYEYDNPENCPCQGPLFPANDCAPWGTFQSTSGPCTNTVSTWRSNDLVNPYGNEGYWEQYTANTTATETKSGEIDPEAITSFIDQKLSKKMDILKNNKPQNCFDTKCGFEKYSCWGGVNSFTPVELPTRQKLKLGVVGFKKFLEKYSSISGDIKVYIPAPWDEESGDPEPNNCPCSPDFDGEMVRSIGFSISSSGAHYSGEDENELVITESSELDNNAFQGNLETLSLSLCINTVTPL